MIAETTYAPLSVLIVDDDRADQKLARRALTNAMRTFEVQTASSIEEALELGDDGVQCVVVDHRLPGVDGLDGLELLRRRWPEAGFVFVTGHGDGVLVRDALKRGAHDYVPKNEIDTTTLERAILGALQQVELRRQLRQERGDLESFAALLAHDLSAPARRMRWGARCMREELEAGRGDDALAELGTLEEAADRLDRLVTTLHEYTLGLRDIPARRVLLSDVVDAALVHLELAILEKGAVVEVSPLPAVIGNDEQLVQLVQNLLANALKYSDKSAPRIRVGADERPDGVVEISIADDGPGIEAEYLTSIFLPFRRLHAQSDVPGSGLGLATCEKILERHAGEIWGTSSPGEGATFTFTLRSGG